ncbi:tetratricopeptide repeat protein [Actinocrinis puniceicyclus]|uniref:Tetratricopeptide repeat protein n=1 Tax=Actinocrinis puniceicyclus TaxID=977794 RepID=A0A8J7WQU1_9ACTN|nr:tetratricopeptide repeat protein [Actinocrinis puniceicyclus]MBS2964292.1 tetratricopeptide repeat protein [Actinocrinis puniceicyclus]
MRQSAGDPSRPEGVSSTLAGAAHDVVQARDIAGGVHFYTAQRTENASAVPHQLPADLRGFVGRRGELDKLEALLSGGDEPVTLVVVAGTAGVGKTSLAVHFAHLVRSRFPDGQLFVNLRGYDPGTPLTSAGALERFLRALGVAPGSIPAGVEERAALYRTLLAGRRVLVVLDNAATAGQVRPLLPGEAGSLAVVTCRGRLSGLSARDGARRITVGLLTETESVALVNTVTTGYRAGDDPAQVAQLARLCARLPLALRIAAERAAARPLMPLRELIADLRDESSLWDALSIEDDADADAVRTVFAWSYRALPPAAARAFRLLGLHPGTDFSLAAAAALLDETPERTRALLDVLTGAHLLEQTGSARHQFHDLLRAYAADLAASQEEEAAQRAALLRAAHWYLRTADTAMRATQSLRPSVLTGSPGAYPPPFGPDDRTAANDWYVAERANLLALAHAAAQARLDEIAWQLSASVQTLQAAHGDTDDRLEMGQLGLQAARRLGDRRAEARVLQGLGFAWKAAGQGERALSHHLAALEIFTVQRDRLGVIEAHNSIGLIHLRHRELDDAADRFEQTVRLAEADGHRAWHAVALDNLARTRLEQGRLAQVVELADRAMRVHREIRTEGAPLLETLITLIRAHRESGRLDRAQECTVSAERILEGGTRYAALEVDIALERAAITLESGDAGGASEMYLNCLRLQRRLNDPAREAATYCGIGTALRSQGRVEEAIDFHRRAVAARRALPDAYRLAVELGLLAQCLDAAGQTEQARPFRAEARELAGAFTDPRAAALHARLSALADP